MSKMKRSLATSGRNGHINGTSQVNRVEGFFDNPIVKPEESTGPDLTIKRSVEGRTPNQKAYLKSIKQNDITFCTGPAGTGKTHLGIGLAASYLSSGKATRIILVRPAVSCDEDLGFLPGDLLAKLGNYLRPAYDELLEFFTIKQLNNLLSGKFPIIEGVALGQMKGRTFKKSVVILDEAQDATYKQLKNFLTRMGEDTKVIVTGDVTQSDRYQDHQDSPLEEVMRKMEGAEGVGFIRFTPADIQRHPRTEQILSRL